MFLFVYYGHGVFASFFSNVPGDFAVGCHQGEGGWWYFELSWHYLFFFVMVSRVGRMSNVSCGRGG